MKPPGIMPTFVKPMDSYRCWAASLEATTALNCRPRKPFLPQVSMQFSTSLRPRPRPREADATAKLALAMRAAPDAVGMQDVHAEDDAVHIGHHGGGLSGEELVGVLLG